MPYNKSFILLFSGWSDYLSKSPCFITLKKQTVSRKTSRSGFKCNSWPTKDELSVSCAKMMVLHACINLKISYLRQNKKEMKNQPASHLFVWISLLKIVFRLMINQIQLFDIEISYYFKQLLWWLLSLNLI